VGGGHILPCDAKNVEIFSTNTLLTWHMLKVLWVTTLYKYHGKHQIELPYSLSSLVCMIEIQVKCQKNLIFPKCRWVRREGSDKIFIDEIFSLKVYTFLFCLHVRAALFRAKTYKVKLMFGKYFYTREKQSLLIFGKYINISSKYWRALDEYNILGILNVPGFGGPTCLSSHRLFL